MRSFWTRIIWKSVGIAVLFAILTCGVTALGADTTKQGGPSASKEKDEYRLGPGDSVGVLVLNHSEYSTEFLIPRGGAVVFPEVGEISVSGMTLPELTKTLTTRYKSVLLDPHVTVVLKGVRVQQITVIGDIQHPTVMPLLPGTHVADCIGAGGGLLPEFKASECEVTVLHSNGDRMNAHLLDVLAGDPQANILLAEGDTVSVDSGVFTVYVIGQVKTPGVTHVKRGGGLLEAIASAGGVTDAAAIDRVRVTNLEGADNVVDLVPALIKGQSLGFRRLSQGDLITVPTTTEQFAVLGYVQSPGVFPMPQGQTVTLATAISQAKGQAPKSRLSRVAVTRLIGGKPVQKYYNFGRYLTKGDETQNPQIFAGDVVFVPETNQIDSSTALGSAEALSLIWSVLRR